MFIKLKIKKHLLPPQGQKTIRRKRGSALISGMLVGMVSLLWITSICGSMLAVYQANTKDRAQGALRNATETALEWSLTQLNNDTGTITDPGDNQTSIVSIPADIISAVSPGISLSASATLANVAASVDSYLYNPSPVVTVDTSNGTQTTANQWRVLTVTATTGGMFPKTKSIRVVLKPRTAMTTIEIPQSVTTYEQQEVNTPTTTTVTTTSYPLSIVPNKMLIANSVGVGGSGRVNGDVHSNGNLSLSGSNIINGNITTAGNFSISGSGNITGGIQSLGNITLNSQVTGPVTSKGSISTGGSSSVTGDINALGNVNLTSSMTANGNVRTGGSLTTSGSYTMSGGDVFAAGSQSASGSFSMSGGNMVTGSNFNLGWGSMSNGGNVNKGKVYYGGSNQSPAWSNGANMSTNGTAIKIVSTDGNYANNYTPANNALNAALATATTAAAPVTIPAAPDRPSGATLLSATALTKSGANNVTIAAGDYYINGPIDFSGSTNLTVTGPVRLWLEGSNAYIKFAGSNNITLPNGNDPSNLQIYTNSSKPITFSGSTNVALGYIYAPNATVTMSGSNNANVGGIVASSINFSGSSGLVRTSTSAPWGSTSSGYTTTSTSTTTTYTTTYITTPVTTTTVVPVTVNSFQNSWQVASYQEM
ncbi:MAG: FapA family protein [Candidatus Obscuribacterales bacterium]|nr:FapA family protein [Candidatus Obscuribacterales bacterium]